MRSIVTDRDFLPALFYGLVSICARCEHANLEQSREKKYLVSVVKFEIVKKFSSLLFYAANIL